MIRVSSAITIFLILVAGTAYAADSSHRTEIIVGSELDYPPYALVGEGGKADGFSVDLMKAVTNVMGIKVTFRVGLWSEVRKALEDGEVDALPLVSYSKEREKLFDFTTPHTVSYATIFKRTGTPDINSVKEIQGKSIITMRSDATHDWLLQNNISEHLVLTETVSETLRLLASGEHDYALAPRLVGLLTVNKLNLTNIEAMELRIDAYGRGYGFAVKDGDYVLLSQLNQGLAIIKETGRYDEIYEKWFGIVDPKGIESAVITRYVIWGAGVLAVLISLTLTWIIVLRRTVDMKTAEVRHAYDDLELRVEERTRDFQKEIIERKRAEDLVTRLGRIIEQSVNEVYVFDAETLRFSQVNYGAQKNLGYTIDELKMLTPLDLKPEFTMERFEELIKPLRDGSKESITFQAIHKRKDSTIYDVEIFLQLMQLESPPVFVAIILDITERRQAEQALRKAKVEAEIANRSKTEFLANMSHDLRTPLNAIMGFAEMMNARTFGLLGDPHYEEYARDIHNSGSLLVSLIDDILDISKIEAGKYELNEENLDIPSLIQKSVKMITPLAKTGKLHLVTDIEPDLPMLRGDKRAITQIFNNLLSNAVKFTPVDGKVTITAQMDGSGFVNVLVADTGEGMSSHDITRVLKPFEQAESTHSRHHEGTGLGLHLCQKFIELHDGEIKLQSKVGKGTTVTVLFPPERIVVSREGHVLNLKK